MLLKTDSKNDRKNLFNSHGAAESLIICTLMGYFCHKNVMFELKNTEELFRQKFQNCGFKNDIRNLVNFHIIS